MNNPSKITQKRNLRNVVVVIPTYNESANIVRVLDLFYKAVAMQRDTFKINPYVLIVDDSSPDGTAKKVREYKKKNPFVHILVRKQREGLGAAYIHGFKHAMKKFNPDVIVEMDADGQHNPKDVFRLVSELRKGYDFVIGSRHVEGGRISGDWGFNKRLKSYFARVITQKGLGIKGVKDTSGGFRAIHVDVLKKINLDCLGVKGYSFQASLLEAAYNHKFFIKEIPIVFDQRTHGESKMRVSDMVEGWKLVIGRRIERLQGKGP